MSISMDESNVVKSATENQWKWHDKEQFYYTSTKEKDEGATPRYLPLTAVCSK